MFHVPYFFNHANDYSRRWCLSIETDRFLGRRNVRLIVQIQNEYFFLFTHDFDDVGELTMDLKSICNLLICNSIRDPSYIDCY